MKLFVLIIIMAILQGVAEGFYETLSNSRVYVFIFSGLYTGFGFFASSWLRK